MTGKVLMHETDVDAQWNGFLNGLLQLLGGCSALLMSVEGLLPHLWAAAGQQNFMHVLRGFHLFNDPIRVVSRMRTPVIIRSGQTGPSALLREWPAELSDFRSVWVFPVEWNSASAALVLLQSEDRAPTLREWQYCLWYATHMRLFTHHYQSGAKTDIFQMFPFISNMENKDPYVAGHSMKVASYAAQLALKVGLPGKEVERIYYGALLHDLGKVGISDTVLQKPGGLSDDEFAEIRRHPVIGSNYIESWPELLIYRDIIRHHHERLDGHGYPDGLKEADISVPVRIVSIADAFDAMTSRRVYRDALSKREAIRELHKGSGSQFDGTLVALFERCLRQSPYQRVHSLCEDPTACVME